MERPLTPPSASARDPTSPLTPEATRRIEENRLRAKAIRSQRDADARNAGLPTIPRTASGIIETDHVRITAVAGSKRPFSATEHAEVPSTNRNGRKPAGALRPAPKFTRFVDYNMSAMTDTKGGFLSTEDDPHNPALGKPAPRPGAAEKPKHMSTREWERLQTIQRLRRNKAGPYEPGLSVMDDVEKRKKCRECDGLELDWVWDEVFRISVCHACKDKYPEKYSLLTKTECKEDYLLTDSELRDVELLPHLSKPNPHKSHWHDMMLFLRLQVEEYAINQKWGSAEKLDAEFEKREEQKKRRKEAKFKEKLLDLKKKTRTEAFRKQHNSKRFGGVGTRFGHVHTWGRAVENSDGATVKKCLECNMEVEELTF